VRKPIGRASTKPRPVHYADAIPLDLLKTEQSRITAQIKAADARLAALDGSFIAAEANLTRALSLARDCEAAYREASDKVRRQFNQAFFKRLLIDDEYNVTGELASPFDILLSDELRQSAALRAEEEMRSAVEELLHDHEQDFESNVANTDFEMAVSTTSKPPGWPRPPLLAKGLKYETMVGAEGLEPPTSAV
jgi:site-specific DNA recombinase